MTIFVEASVRPSVVDARSPETVLVVSDLHLGVGASRYSESGISRKRPANMESTAGHILDVIASCDPSAAASKSASDMAFHRWLRFHHDRARAGALLVLNGDTFDFLRVTRIPGTPDDFATWARRLPQSMRCRAAAKAVSRDARRFGFGTEECKSVWKLLVIAEAHPVFFSALAQWVSHGGRILFVKGNHDLELHWSAVQSAIADEIVRHVHLAPLTVPFSDDSVRSNIAFAQGGFELSNLWIEHGHRWERMTAVRGTPVTGASESLLRVPLGAFLGRYILNGLERHGSRPAGADRPTRPFGVSTVLATTLTLALVTWSESAALLILMLAVALVSGSAVSSDALQRILDYGEEYLVARSSASLARAADSMLASEPAHDASVATARYVVMGHTHIDADQLVTTIHGDAYYVNTGAWDPEMLPRSQRSDSSKSFKFARFDTDAAGSYSHALLNWNDALGIPEKTPHLPKRRSSTTQNPTATTHFAATLPRNTVVPTAPHNPL